MLMQQTSIYPQTEKICGRLSEQNHKWVEEHECCNYHKGLERQAWANSVDPDQKPQNKASD